MGSKTMKKTIKLVMQQCKLFQFKDLIKLLVVVVVVVVVVVIKVSYLRHKCNKFNVNKKNHAPCVPPVAKDTS